MWFDLLLPLVYFTAGWLVGLLMVRRSAAAAELMASQPPTSVLLETADAPEIAVAEAAEYLRQFAGSLAADVDAHQTKVQAVNDSLLESTDQMSSDVICVAVNRLVEANEMMQRQLQSAQDQIQTQASQLETAERRAQTDGLTRVGNRRAFDDHFAARYALGAGRAGTLALLDIDYFKQFNDTHGHRAGDEVLRVVAGLLNVRLSKYGIVARYGGEEFAFVLDGYTVQQSIPIVEAARKAIGQREVVFENKRLRVSASMGVAELAAGETAERWLQRADDCLYHSKHAGRDCGHWADGESCRLIEDTAAKTPADAAPSAEPLPKIEPVPEDAPAGADNAVADGASASPDEPVGSEPEARYQAPVPGNLFPYLPDRVVLRQTLRELAQQHRGGRMPMAVMAIQMGEHVSGPVSRSLLQIVRATARSTDRIGCQTPSTLLFCMPNSDAASAAERAQQIYCSTETVRLAISDAAGGSHLGIGIATCDAVEDFDEAVRVTTELAKAAIDDSSQPIRFAEAEAIG